MSSSAYATSFATAYHHPSSESPAAVGPTVDIPEQIKKLAALRDEGILSDAEFEEKRRSS